MTDEAIRAALIRDVRSGFDALVPALMPRVHGFAYRLCGDAHRAEELAQETFVRAYLALNTWPDERIAALMPIPWLFRIALNLHRNGLRQQHSDGEPHCDDGASLVTELPGDAADWPEPAAIHGEERGELVALVATLPAHLRLALVLRHVEGLTYPQIAAMLGQPAGTIKSHVHRAIRQLRLALADPAERK